jgi:hypothetical protein
MEWKAGLATVKITPEKPVPMAGYASRTKPFEKVEQDIYAKALALEDRQGHRAVLFGYACHNTTLTQTNYNVCGDYAGFAQAYVQERLPGAQAMFMIGCGGNANPYPRGAMADARENGATLRGRNTPQPPCEVGASRSLMNWP